MIYIHRFQMAFGHKKIDHVKVYDSHETAKRQQQVIGGSIQTYEAVENLAMNDHIKDLAVDEVSCIIDELSTAAPGFPRMMEPDSEEWRSWKVKTLNNIRNLLDEIN